MSYDYMHTTNPVNVHEDWEFVTIIEDKKSWRHTYVFRKEHIQKAYVS